MIQLKKALTVPGQASYTYGETIDEEGIDAIVEAVNKGFATSGLKTSIGSWNWLWTNSESWTGEGDNNSEDDLNDYNLAIRPARAEIDGLDVGGAFVYVLVFEFFGESLDLRISLEGLNDQAAVAGVVAQETLSFEASTTWERAVMVVDTNDYEAFKVKLEFIYNGESDRGELYAGTLEEIRYVNTAYDVGQDLASYCSDWVGQYADGESFPADTYLDGDGSLYPFYRRDFDGPPQMSRDAVRPGVHAVRFNGTNQLVTDPYTLRGGDGVIVSMAFRDFDQNVDGVLFTKRANGPSYAFYCFLNGSDIRWRIYLGNPNDATYSNFNFNSLGTRPPQGMWVEITFVWSQSRRRLEIWGNGQLMDTFSTGSTYTEIEDSAFEREFSLNAFTMDAYHLNAEVSTPIVISRDLSLRELERFHQWRRSQHGIY